MAVSLPRCLRLSKLDALWVQALEAAQPTLKDQFEHPGYMNTILVPTNAAWDAALEQYGGCCPAHGTARAHFAYLAPTVLKQGRVFVCLAACFPLVLD